MVASIPESVRIIGIALLLIGLPAPASTQLASPGLPISLDADSSEFDRRNNVMVFRMITIRQGDLTISANQARSSELDFGNAEWIFTGNVLMTSPDARLEAQSATLRFLDHDLRSARVVGKPAQFEQQRTDTEKPVQGRAELMEYDLDSQLIKLSGSAWLREGNNEILGETIAYNIGEQRVLATSDAAGSQRVQITITPDEEQELELPRPPPDK